LLADNPLARGRLFGENRAILGCLTNWDSRDLELPLDFLRDGRAIAEIYADAPDAREQPTHTVIQNQDVTRATKLMLHLAPGGGTAVRIRPPAE